MEHSFHLSLQAGRDYQRFGRCRHVGYVCPPDLQGDVSQCCLSEMQYGAMLLIDARTCLGRIKYPHFHDCFGFGPAHVYIVLHGSKRSFAPQMISLEPASGTMSKGECRDFEFELPDLGLLSKIRVGHSSKHVSDCWLLERIDVTNLDDAELGKTSFFCDRWIGRGKPDAELSVELEQCQDLTEYPPFTDICCFWSCGASLRVPYETAHAGTRLSYQLAPC